MKTFRHLLLAALGFAGIALVSPAGAATINCQTYQTQPAANFFGLNTQPVIPCDRTGALWTANPGGGGSGGTSSAYGAAFPATGTAAGFTDGTNMQPGKVDANNNLFMNLRSGATEVGTAAAPLRIDPTGTTPQPVTGTFFQATQPISAVSLPLPTGAMGATGGTVGLVAGAAIIGKVGIDQTTPGTTNGVVVNSGTLTAVTAITNALPAGTNLMGKVGIDQTTPGTTNAVAVQPVTSGGLTWFLLEPAASDNHANIKNGAGQVYHIAITNNSATVNYIRLYNAGTGFNGCGAATNILYEHAIPASTSGAGYVDDIAAGIAFSTGISICVTSTYGQTSVAAATAASMAVNIGYK